jgi:hypothetical protein
MGRGFNLLVQIFALPGVLDSQCGFKLLSAKASEDLFRNLYIYSGKSEINSAFTGAFDVELLFLAKKYGYKFKEVAIKWKHYQTDRVSPIKDSILMLIDILKIRWADLTKKYPKK